MNFILLFLSILVSLLTCFQVAEAKSNCALCTQISGIEKDFKKSSEKGIEETIQLFGKVKLSADAKLRAQEIHSIVRLAAITIPVSKVPEVDDYFYTLHEEHAKEYEKEIKKLSTKEQKILRSSLKNMEQAYKKGNG